MENLIVSILLIIFVIAFTAINSYFVVDICNDMNELISIGETEAAREIWDKKKDYISVFVRDAEIDVVDSEFDMITEKTPNEDGEAETDITSLTDAITELLRSEKPELINIFIIDINRGLGYH